MSTLLAGFIILDVALYSNVIRSYFEIDLQFGQLVSDSMAFIGALTHFTVDLIILFNVYKSFDFKNMDTNFKKMCSDYASNELFLNAAVTVVLLAFATISLRF
jgi:hypothetical protein